MLVLNENESWKMLRFISKPKQIWEPLSSMPQFLKNIYIYTILTENNQPEAIWFHSDIAKTFALKLYVNA